MWHLHPWSTKTEVLIVTRKKQTCQPNLELICDFAEVYSDNIYSGARVGESKSGEDRKHRCYQEKSSVLFFALMLMKLTLRELIIAATLTSQGAATVV